MKQLNEPLYLVGDVENGVNKMRLRFGGYSGIRVYRRLGMAEKDQKLNGGRIYRILEMEEMK